MAGNLLWPSDIKISVNSADIDIGRRALGRVVQDIWFEVQDTGHGVQDKGSGMQEMGCRLPLPRCSISSGRSAARIPAVGLTLL